MDRSFRKPFCFFAENWEDLAPVYEQLIELRPNEIQFYAALAFTYKELGEYEKAREQALKVIEIDPSKKAETDEFLKTLK